MKSCFVRMIILAARTKLNVTGKGDDGPESPGAFSQVAACYEDGWED